MTPCSQDARHRSGVKAILLRTRAEPPYERRADDCDGAVRFILRSASGTGV